MQKQKLNAMEIVYKYSALFVERASEQISWNGRRLVCAQPDEPETNGERKTMIRHFYPVHSYQNHLESEAP